MSSRTSYFRGMRMLLWSLTAILLAACANMGRPEGGPRDELPPEFVRSNPAPGSTGVKTKRLTAFFNENIQLEDAFSKVVVSPAQKTPPAISANGHRLTVEFRDTLLPNTTYTIDFADAIKDLNEGNILDGFALDFSTGDSIDSLRISGMVLKAENLEPAQGMLVGVYSNLSDTAITTLPFERIARTNQYGHFTIRNLKEGVYRIFAVNDVNRDYHWDRSEDIAFYDTLIVPTVERIEVTDTLFASDGSDSLVRRDGVRFLPNDILLSWFNVGYKSSYITDYKREDKRRIKFTFGAPADSLPKITIAGGVPDGEGRDISEWALLKANTTLDTLEYWIADPAVLEADSLRLSVEYFKTDTADHLVWTADTLRFYYRDPQKKNKKKEKDKKKPEAPLFTVDSLTGDTTFLPPPDMEYLSIRVVGGAMQELNKPLVLETGVPVSRIDTSAMKLEMLVDTVWHSQKFTLLTDSSDILLRHKIDMAWKGGSKYRFSVDTLGLTSIYNTWNRPYKQEFTVKNPEDYSNLRFVLPGLDSVAVVVQLLNTSDAPAYTAFKPAGQSAVDLRFLSPGKYYARLFIDSNANGKWDTGSPLDSIQPEEVYYFSKKLDLKKNWDIEQTWNVDELAVDVQKPWAIKQNKPKLKRGEQAPVDPDEEQEYEDENYNPFDRTGRNNNRNGRSQQSSGIQPGGIRRATTR